MSDLRDRVADVIDHASTPHSAAGVYAIADAVLAVFAGRERELRARIEALPIHPILGGVRWREAVLAAFDEVASDGKPALDGMICKECGGVDPARGGDGHVLGCPEQLDGR